MTTEQYMLCAILSTGITFGISAIVFLLFIEKHRVTKEPKELQTAILLDQVQYELLTESIDDAIQLCDFILLHEKEETEVRQCYLKSKNDYQELAKQITLIHIIL